MFVKIASLRLNSYAYVQIIYEMSCLIGCAQLHVTGCFTCVSWFALNSCDFAFCEGCPQSVFFNFLFNLLGEVPQLRQFPASYIYGLLWLFRGCVRVKVFRLLDRCPGRVKPRDLPSYEVGRCHGIVKPMDHVMSGESSYSYEAYGRCPGSVKPRGGCVMGASSCCDGCRATVTKPMIVVLAASSPGMVV